MIENVKCMTGTAIFMETGKWHDITHEDFPD